MVFIIKKWLFAAAAVIGLGLLANNHLGRSFGDELFSVMGMSPWVGGSTRAHVSTLIGIALLITGIAGIRYYLRPKYPRILSAMIIGCIAVFILSPFVSKQVMYVLKANSSGLSAIDYLKDKSECRVQTVEKKAKADCSFQIYSYSKEAKLIFIKPDLSPLNPKLDFDGQVFELPPEGPLSFGISFYSQQELAADFHGSMEKVGAEIEIDGEKEKFE